MQPAYPNSFAVRFAIPLLVTSTERIRAAVYSLDGRRVRGLYDARLEAGAHDLAWDGTDDSGRRVVAGTYLVRVEGESGVRTVKATLLR